MLPGSKQCPRPLFSHAVPPTVSSHIPRLLQPLAWHLPSTHAPCVGCMPAAAAHQPAWLVRYNAFTCLRAMASCALHGTPGLLPLLAHRLVVAYVHVPRPSPSWCYWVIHGLCPPLALGLAAFSPQSLWRSRQSISMRPLSVTFHLSTSFRCMGVRALTFGLLMQHSSSTTLHTEAVDTFHATLGA